jgi:ribosomal-protein-alanine N-acetyltransferase
LDNLNGLVLRTARLELVACTVELARAEAAGVQALAAILQTARPSSWPPPLNDDNSQRWVREQLERDPTIAGWTMWYFVLTGEGGRQLIGNGGFKGRPKDGLVELGYSILPGFQRNGYATEATRALITWAFSHPAVERVAAETLPELEPSLGVMRKCGMKYVGKGAPEEGVETVHYEVTRQEWASR